MIIECICGEKKFEVSPELIPASGRTIKCGSCDKIWFYKPSKTAMQSGLKKFDKWVIEFITNDPSINPLMGWESSNDTYTELKLEFSTKELAINYPKNKKIDYELIEPKKRKIVKKSYTDNFLK